MDFVKLARALTTVLNINAGTPTGASKQIPPLPPELVTYIVDFVVNDRKTLLACSRVSRTWRVIAVNHLFSCIDISFASQLAKFIDQVKSSPLFASSIRTLRFYGSKRSKTEDSPLVVSAMTIRDILPFLPNLKDLQCSDISLSSQTAVDQDERIEPENDGGRPAIGVFTLERLTLVRCGLLYGSNTQRDLIAWLSTFTSIGLLKLLWIGFDLDWPDGVPDVLTALTRLASGISPTLRIDSLKIEDYPRRIQFYFELFRHTCAIQTLSSVSIGSRSRWDPGCVGNLLRDVTAGNLREISLNIHHRDPDNPSDTDTFPERLGLGLPSCAALETLAIHYAGANLDTWAEAQSHPWQILHSVLLSCAAADTLRELRLGFDISVALRDEPPERWTVFRDVVLARFRALETVFVVCTDSCVDEGPHGRALEEVLALRNGVKFVCAKSWS